MPSEWADAVFQGAALASSPLCLPVVFVPPHHEDRFGRAGELLEAAVAPRVSHVVP